MMKQKSKRNEEKEQTDPLLNPQKSTRHHVQCALTPEKVRKTQHKMVNHAEKCHEARTRTAARVDPDVIMKCF
jgi:hypothetical protein